MGNWTDILYLIAILVEAALFCYLECKIWKTLYTPLNFLMLPYLIVLFITIMFAGGKLGLVEFYYPSIFIWNVGLLIFFIPSIVIGGLMTYYGKNVVSETPQDRVPPSLLFMCVVIALLFVVRLRGFMSNPDIGVGTSEFSDGFSAGGLWGHLRILTLPLLMASIYYVSRKRWWLWPVIMVFVVVSVLNQVIGWVVIPVLAAMAMRIYTGKTRLTMRFILFVLLGAFSVFFISYALTILVVQSRGIDPVFLEFIYKHFLHYLTSGTLGWSMDLQCGLPDATGNFEVVIVQFVNLFKAIMGDNELVSPLNPLYYNIGWELTNVRTFFGTLYINSNWISFTSYILVLSSFMYLLRVAMVRFNNIYVYTIYFFFSGMLMLGWFDFYFAALTVLELPIMVLFLILLEKILYKKQQTLEPESGNDAG